MGQTTKYKLPWPEMGQSSDGPGAFRKLAEATEVGLDTVDLAPGIMRHRAADFNVAGNSTTVPFGLDVTTYSHGTWALASSGFPILPQTGRWLFILSVVYGHVSGAAGHRHAAIFLDGGGLSGASMTMPYNSANSVTINVAVARSVAKGRVVGLYGWQSSGKTVPVTEAHLSINWLGAS